MLILVAGGGVELRAGDQRSWQSIMNDTEVRSRDHCIREVRILQDGAAIKMRIRKIGLTEISVRQRGACEV